MIELDYDRIKDREEDDLLVKDKDIVIVPESGVKNFFPRIGRRADINPEWSFSCW